MKILYVTDVFPPRCGGSGWSVYFFARALRQCGHDVSILSLDGRKRTYDGFVVEALNLSHANTPFLGSWLRENRDLPRVARRIEALLGNIEVAHAHHRFSAIALATAAGNGFYVTVRDYWPVCFCGRSQFRTENICNVYDFSRCSESESPWKGIAAPLFYPWFEARNRRWRDLLRPAHTVFCISHYLRDQLQPAFNESRLVVLPNFAEDLVWDGNQELPERFLLYVGRLEKNKGVHLLPEILSKSRVSIPVLIVGDGSLRQVLENSFKEREIPVHFLGYLEYPRMLAVLKRAEMILFPSLWAEPLGRVLIEAGMMGKPTIAFDQPGGHHDIVRHNVSGLLANSPDRFAESIALLASKRSLRETLGAGARKIYEDSFSPHAVIPKLLSYYA